MNVNLENLNKDYLQGKVVPFIGAGLSAPFKVPTWRALIEEITNKYATGKYLFVKQSVDVLLDRNDYWKAVDQIKEFLYLADQDIQTEIVNIIEEKMIQVEDDQKHNYLDLASMDFNLYLTTNYENLLNQYVKCDVPLILKDIIFNTQDLFDKKRVVHLHGYTSNSGSVVISRESYKELYNNDKYKDLLKLVTGTKKLLFIGFSFDDQFIRQLIKDHKDYFMGNHYILLDKPGQEKIKELKIEFGLTAIEYDSSNSTHSEEIRKILATMREKNKEENTSSRTEKSQSVVIGATITDLNKDVEGNLFYKKLKVENIDPFLIELSSAFYVAAEIYIRDLKKNGMKVNVIDGVLRKVFTTYAEKYYDTYKKNGDSQEFVEVVHDSLKNIDLGRLAMHFGEGEVSDEHENRGLIHILAEDEDQKVWWGDKRLE